MYTLAIRSGCTALSCGELCPPLTQGLFWEWCYSLYSGTPTVPQPSPCRGEARGDWLSLSGWSGVLTLAHPRLCQKSHGNGGVLDGSCGRALQNRGVCTALYASSREKIFSFEDVRVIRSGGKAKKVKMWGVTAISSQHVPAELHTCIPGQGVSH
jgi:hypothetical protein